MPVFPFDLAGPPFLVFYAAFGTVVLLGSWYHASRLGSSGRPPRLAELTSDPYRVAYLREGAEEAVRLAVVNLVDRGVLAVSGSLLQASGKADEESLRRPLDRAIITRCGALTAAPALYRDARVRAACNDYERDLQTLGLLRDDELRSQAARGMVVSIALLGGIAAARIVQALSHGRYNILFLVGLALLACVMARRLYAARPTQPGRKALSDLKILMSRLKSRASRFTAGGATNEAVLFASVFGIHALPPATFPFVNGLFPRLQSRSSGGDSGGSSDAGGSGDSGGSSCGSSCGGGCGGCGGS